MPRIQEQIGEVVMVNLQERVVGRSVEQNVDGPVPQFNCCCLHHARHPLLFFAELLRLAALGRRRHFAEADQLARTPLAPVPASLWASGHILSYRTCTTQLRQTGRTPP